MHHLLTTLTDVVALVPLDKKPGTNWNAPPAAPPGMDSIMPTWVGWAKYAAIGGGILGLIACGIMMMIGRRNRSHLAAEGASGLLWVMAGLSIVALAGGVVPAIVGG
ncbi:hypothetical protein ABTY59_33520 [Streptomyces sp. NPDC096079]|uniref:hypothetical protein n=1 Tax=Streptomyces sp. NPDC096079 TaxID=3155820 RepID=UPI00331790DD